MGFGNGILKELRMGPVLLRRLRTPPDALNNRFCQERQLFSTLNIAEPVNFSFSLLAAPRILFSSHFALDHYSFQSTFQKKQITTASIQAIGAVRIKSSS
jgi:hypothetical protein